MHLVDNLIIRNRENTSWLSIWGHKICDERNSYKKRNEYWGPLQQGERREDYNGDTQGLTRLTLIITPRSIWKLIEILGKNKEDGLESLWHHPEVFWSIFGF